MLTGNQTPRDPTQLKSTWVEKKNALHSVHSAIKEIDGRLQSWGLSIWDALGLGPKDVKDEEELYILPNSKLSKRDLQHKLSLLHYKKEELEGELKSLQATAQQLKVNVQSENERAQDQYIKKDQDQALELYSKNQNMFFADVLFDPLVEWAQQKEQVYNSANKIIAVCPLFSTDTEPDHLWQAWKIVARARDIETIENASSKRYANGAEKFIRQIISMLPIEMQGIKILYDAKDYDRLEHYMSEVYVRNALEDDSAYAELLGDLMDEIHLASTKMSTITLSNNKSFNSLPKQVKDQLITQHVYTTQARFYLSLVDNVVWRNYVKIIDENINAVINKTIEPNVCENEFVDIRKKIAQNVQDKIKLAKMEMEQDFLKVNSQLLSQQGGT